MFLEDFICKVIKYKVLVNFKNLEFYILWFILGRKKYGRVWVRENVSYWLDRFYRGINFLKEYGLIFLRILSVS